MWTILSRSRPSNITRLIRSCHDTNMTTSVVVVLDDDDPMLDSYLVLNWPVYWSIRVGKRAPQADLYNRVFAEFPDQDWFGILADDIMPMTQRWDIRLIEAAGLDGLAAPSGGHHPTIAPHFCLGGDLVREFGWLCLPGLNRIYVDTVWNDIARERGVFRYLPDVIVEHWHFSNGKALLDDTYRKSAEVKALDKEIYNTWCGE